MTLKVVIFGIYLPLIVTLTKVYILNICQKHM